MVQRIACTKVFSPQTWISPKRGQGCTLALRYRDRPSAHALTCTTATYARSRGCVDLYFGSPPSKHSGLQRCLWGRLAVVAPLHGCLRTRHGPLPSRDRGLAIFADSSRRRLQ